MTHCRSFGSSAGRTPWGRSWRPRGRVAQFWAYNVEALHFLYGGLLSAYVVLYVRSSTLARPAIFLALLVLVMVVTLSLSGISGLSSYRDAVHDLDAVPGLQREGGVLGGEAALLFQHLIQDAPIELPPAAIALDSRTLNRFSTVQPPPH